MGKASRTKAERKREAEESPTVRTIIEWVWADMGHRLDYRVRAGARSQLTLDSLAHKARDRHRRAHQRPPSTEFVDPDISAQLRKAESIDEEVASLIGTQTLLWAHQLTIPAVAELAMSVALEVPELRRCVETTLRVKPEQWHPMALDRPPAAHTRGADTPMTDVSEPSALAAVQAMAVRMTDHAEEWLIGCAAIASHLMITRSVQEMVDPPSLDGDDQVLNPWGWNPADEPLWAASLPDGFISQEPDRMPEQLRPFMRKLSRRIRLARQVLRAYDQGPPGRPAGPAGAVFSEYTALVHLLAVVVTGAVQSLMETAWSGDSLGMDTTADIHYGMLRAMLQAEAFWLPAHLTEAVVSSTGLSEDDVAQLRLPYDAVAVYFGAPIRVEGDHLWADTIDQADHTPLVKLQPHYRNLAKHGHTWGLHNGPDAVAASADPRAQAVGVVLLANDDGSLSDRVLWLVDTPGTQIKDGEPQERNYTSIIFGSIRRSGMAQVVHNAAAMVCLGPWDLREVEGQQVRPVGARAQQRADGTDTRHRDPLLRIRVLATERLVPAAAAEEGGAERTVRSHLRRGHWRRQRVGPREAWMYRPAWIHPTVVNPGAQEPDTKVVCTVRARSAGTKRDHPTSGAA